MARTKSKKIEEIKGKLDARYLVQKSDPLVLMRSVPFSLGELKILDTYISRINISDGTRNTVMFTKEEYEELMGLTCVDYRTLKKHTESMLGKVVTLEMPDKEYLQFVLFEQARYHKDEYGKPIIELTCTKLAQDLFFCIDKYHYFSYALENVIKLTRKSSYLLYIYIRYNRYRGEWDVSVDELRDTILDCKGQESYQAFKEFKRAVLDPAVKEVNEKTDCHFEYEAVKRGRRVAKIKFTYLSKGLQCEGQLTFSELPDFEAETIEEPDFDELMEKKYGSQSLAFIADAMNYEFSKEETRVLFDMVLEHYIEPHNDDISRYNFIRHVYNRLLQRAAAPDLKPLNSRYSYMKKLLEQELEKQ